MPARRSDLADLPDWPRGLSREQAAAYVGLSVNTFEALVQKEVKAGRLIAPLQFGRRTIYDRRAIDRWLDRRGGLASDTTSGNRLEAVEW